MLKRLLTSIILFICSFQLAFAEVIINYDLQQDVKSSAFNQLKYEVNDFFEAVYGKELSNGCENASSDELDEKNLQTLDPQIESQRSHEIETFLEQSQKNACGNYAVDENNIAPRLQKSDKSSHCESIKVIGLIDNFVAKIIEHEKNEDEKLDLDDLHREFEILYKKAISIKIKLNNILLSNNMDDATKRQALSLYVQAVPLGMRDLVLVQRNYKRTSVDGRVFYESLMPIIPKALYPELSDPNYKISISKRTTTEFEYLMFGPKAEYILETGEDSEEVNNWVQLQYNEAEMVVRRDAGTILKALTSKNYITALRMLTVFMMAKQIRNYDAMIGYSSVEQDRSVLIPKSCQSKKNGYIPEHLNINFSEHAESQTKIEDDMIYKILFSEGLIGSDGKPKISDYFDVDPKYEETYIDNSSLNPMEDGFSGNTFFENYKIAKKGIDRGFRSIDIDDISQFEAVWNFKISELEKIYKIKGSRGKVTSKSYKDFERIQNFFEFPTEGKSILIEGKNNEQNILYPFNIGANTFLANLMQENGVLSLEEVVPEHIKLELKQSILRIPFPQFYSPGPWRQWALKQLAEFASRNKDVDTTSLQYKAVNDLCVGKRFREAICGESGSHAVANLFNLLEKFLPGQKYIPLRKLENENIEKYWDDLERIWNNLLQNSVSELEDSFVNEYDFIFNQIKSGNKWATIKLSYLLARDGLLNIKNGFEPHYAQTTRGKRLSVGSRCFYGNVNGEIKRLGEFGNIFKLNQPLLPFHGNKVLTASEKEYISKNYILERDDQIANIYDYVENDKNLYEIFENLNYKTILSRSSLETFIQDNLSSRLSTTTQNELADVFSLDLSKRVDSFMSIYMARGDLNRQYTLFKDIESQFEQYDDNIYQFKSDFLKLEDLIKTPIYKDLVRKASLFKINQVYRIMNDFCAADDEDHETIKSIFYSTTKIQNQMNKAMGIEAIPEELLDRVESMPTAEKVDMALGIGSIALGISVLLLSAGTMGIGGILAGYISLAARGALGMQMWLVPREANRKLRADKFEIFVKEMEEMGAAEDGVSENVSVGWTWTAIEAISILPLIGTVARGVKVGDKALKEAIKTSAKNRKKVDKYTASQMAKESGRTVAIEEEIIYAEYILGYRSALMDLKNIFSKTDIHKLKNVTKHLRVSHDELTEIFQKIDKIENLHKVGTISSKEMLREIEKVTKPLQNMVKVGNQNLYSYVGKTSVDFTTEDIYKRGASVIVDYFSNKPANLLKLMKSYDSKWFSKISQLRAQNNKGIFHLSEYKNLEKQGRLTYIQNLLSQAKNGEVGTIRSWFREIRYGHLSEVSSKILSLTKELEIVVKEGGDFKKFVEKNIQGLTIIFKKIPMRKRETAYMVALQGGPHLGIRAPLVGGLADGIILRKITNAISLLAEESMQKEARLLVGLNVSAGVYSSMKVFESISNAIGSAIIEADSLSTAKNLATKLHSFEDKVFNGILTTANEKIQRQGMLGKIKDVFFKNNTDTYKRFLSLDDRYMRKIIFAPSSAEEVSLSKALWKLGFKEDMIWDKDLSKVALEALHELRNYRTLDEYWDYMRVFRMIVGFKDRGIIELM